ncbi:hypothetical protein [Streptomyces yerevanensis]|uniref:hypothetical protein n=1 Tax=Streptomyces yerevanensis TaxID=66378 RepID=UPI000A80AD45|nr:hypothetical protein [Streptomyces yerevanensis]
MDAMWVVAAVMGVQMVAVLVLPSDGQAGLKAFLAGVSLLFGEAILVGGVDGEILVAAMVLLSGGLLFLAELGARRNSPLVSLLWMVTGGSGMALITWRRDDLVEWMETNRSPLAVACLTVALLLGTQAMRRQRLRETR